MGDACLILNAKSRIQRVHPIHSRSWVVVEGVESVGPALSFALCARSLFLRASEPCSAILLRRSASSGTVRTCRGTGRRSSPLKVTVYPTKHVSRALFADKQGPATRRMVWRSYASKTRQEFMSSAIFETPALQARFHAAVPKGQRASIPRHLTHDVPRIK